MAGNNRPLISILTSSFNHEKYVRYFLDSVLAQTCPDWELVIVDDCSTDNNVVEIKKFNDPRIKLIQQPFNMGMNCALTTAFKAASGQYICFFASDDMMVPNFIERITKTIKSHPDVGVIYPYLQCIDENNTALDKEIRPYNSARFGILRELFYNQNVMTSPGMIIKKEVFEQITPLPCAMSQHHDYQIHVELLLRADCYVLPEKLVLYRVPSQKSGISYATTQSAWRCNAEEKFVMDSFLDIKSPELLAKIFGDDIKPFGKITSELIPYVLGCLAIQHSQNEFKKLWGYNTVSQFINQPEHYAMLNKLYHFRYADFLMLANSFDENIYKHKYRKYKKLFNSTVFASTVVLGALIILLIWGI